MTLVTPLPKNTPIRQPGSQELLAAYQDHFDGQVYTWPKHNGHRTTLPMPQKAHFNLYPGFEDMMDTNLEAHPAFHEYCAELEIYSLSFSQETALALLAIDEELPQGKLMIREISEELYPSEDNLFLGRKHGKPGCYTSGCRGVLCRTAATAMQRSRYLGGLSSQEQLRKEALLAQISKSYWAYLTYLWNIIYHRRNLENDFTYPRGHWSKVTLPMTLLLDATQEF